MAGQDVLRENGGHYSWSVVTSDDHLAENVGDNDPDGGGDHGHGYAVQQPVHVATGQINHNVALEKGSVLYCMLILDCGAYPNHWEADQSIQGHKDDKYCVRRLKLSPEEDGVDVVPHVIHGEHQEDTHHHHADAPHHYVGNASMHILAAPESISRCSPRRLYPHCFYNY